jgi:hypothetical protein
VGDTMHCITLYTHAPLNTEWEPHSGNNGAFIGATSEAVCFCGMWHGVGTAGNTLQYRHPDPDQKQAQQNKTTTAAVYMACLKLDAIATLFHKSANTLRNGRRGSHVVVICNMQLCFAKCNCAL